MKTKKIKSNEHDYIQTIATFKIRTSHWLMTTQKGHMTCSNFLQLIIHILNLVTQVDNVSLFYKNMQIFRSKFKISVILKRH